MAKKITDALVMKRENAQPCSVEFAFTLPQDAVKAETDRVVSYVASAVQLPGFRAGHAPMGLVRTKFANEIKDELRNRIFSAAFEKLAEDKDLDVLNVNFKTTPEFKDGEEFSFTYVAVIAPAIELGDYKAMKVDVPLDAVTDDEVAKRIDMYRSMYGTYAEVDGPAVADDMLKVSYKSDFALPEDASASLKRQAAAEDTFLWLSEPEMIPGSIAALTGAEKGKEYTFDATYAADFREAALAGKTVKYTVTVSGIQRRTKLTDAELAEKTGSETFDKFKETIVKSCEAEHASKRRETASEAVMKKLLEAAGEFELPQSLLESEIQRELQNVARESVKSEEDAEKFKKELDAHRKDAEPKAKDALRRTLILRAIARKEQVEVSDAEVEMQMYAMSRHYGCKPKELRDLMEKNGSIDELRMDMMNAKALNTIVDKAIAD